MKLNFSFAAACSLFLAPSYVVADIVLSEKIMLLSEQGALLSNYAYFTAEQLDNITNQYDLFDLFTDEPDQALIAKKDGYCFVAFRGTTLTMDDWYQNVQPGSTDICTSTPPDEEEDETEEKQCCVTRDGFFDAYKTEYADKIEAEIRECAKGCDNKDECVVLTGHSQGGAIAALAGIRLVDLLPYVITYGQPPTVFPPCTIVNSEKTYRYVNTKESELGTIGISYDPVPFAPGFGAEQFGHMILLGPDTTGVAYIGLDVQDQFSPINLLGVEAHSVVGTLENPGYYDRIESLIEAANGTYPIRTNGYRSTNYCTQDKECATGECAKETSFSYSKCVGTECDNDFECVVTGRCDSGICMPKFGSCMTCDENSDCISDRCLLFKCANIDGLMDDQCRCKWNSDCVSGRCEGFAPPICESLLPDGASCDEHSDCASGKCSWFGFKCYGGGVAAAPDGVTSRGGIDGTDESGNNSWSTAKYVGVVIAVILGICIVFYCVTTCRKRAGYTSVST